VNPDLYLCLSIYVNVHFPHTGHTRPISFICMVCFVFFRLAASMPSSSGNLLTNNGAGGSGSGGGGAGKRRRNRIDRDSLPSNLHAMSLSQLRAGTYQYIHTYYGYILYISVSIILKPFLL